MFDLLLDLCLAEAPPACARVHVPLAACAEAGAARAAGWVAAHPGLSLTGWSCGRGAEPAAVTEVAPGVFVHPGRHEVAGPANQGDQANTGFIIGTESVAVIDAGGSRAVAERLLAAVRARTDLPVRWLILTHMHPDHSLGAEVFREAGAEVIGHARLGSALQNRAETYAANYGRLIGRAAFLGTAVVLPDTAVADTRDIDLGGRVLRLTAWPTAHTDNDLTVLDTATGTLWASDLVFDGHVPALDGSITGWLTALDRLGAEPAARIVPGHGGPALPWPGGLAATRDYLSGLATEVRAAIRAGERMGAATARIGAGLQADWQLFDEFNTRNATAAWTELEWE